MIDDIVVVAEHAVGQPVVAHELPYVLHDVQLRARVRDAFVQAARRADRAGFALIEFHAAHGYLISEFLSPLANFRSDAYGGSLANRLRFPCDVVRAVRDVWPRSKAMGVRIPPVQPGYMVPMAARVKREAGIPTMAVGMILTAQQAEQILAEGQADLVALGRGFLDDPRWGIHAAIALGARPRQPNQYGRTEPARWPGYAVLHPFTPAGAPA